jgi:hypothetical protein
MKISKKKQQKNHSMSSISGALVSHFGTSRIEGGAKEFESSLMNSGLTAGNSISGMMLLNGTPNGHL